MWCQVASLKFFDALSALSGPLRNIWYAVTNFATEAVAPSASFQVLGQTYVAY
ncbi:hypothetical protein ACN28S_61535 [Cystobacter fuscus]